MLELQEFIELDRLTAAGQPSHEQLKAGSVEQSACAKAVEKGLSTVKDAADTVVTKVKSVIDGTVDMVTGVVS